MKEIMENWNLNIIPLEIQDGVWSVGQDFILKQYADKEALKRNLNMMKRLEQEGIPTAQPIKLSTGEEFLEMENSYYLLTTKLKGSPVADISCCDEQWFFQMGKLLARLHQAFKKGQPDMDCWENSLLDEMKGWVLENLERYNPTYLEEKEVTETIKELETDYDKLPRQLIHRDVHTGNFLFQKQIFSGYIDFDLSQSNIRIFDICYFLTGLLGEVKNGRLSEENWFMALEKVVEGYHLVSPLLETERNKIGCVMECIELLFLAWFLGDGKEQTAKETKAAYHFLKEHKTKIRQSVSLCSL